MQITVIDVGSPNTHAAKNGRSYQSLEVTFKNEQGQTQSKKLMSFSNPSVFKAAQGWNKGDVVDVQTTKDDAGYWQWTGIGQGGGQVAQGKQANASQTTQGTTRVSGSNYETKEERAERQRFIIRQSSISSAIASLAVGGKSALSADSVIELARQYEAYVFKKEPITTKDGSFVDTLEDDIPL